MTIISASFIPGTTMDDGGTSGCPSIYLNLSTESNHLLSSSQVPAEARDRMALDNEPKMEATDRQWADRLVEMSRYSPYFLSTAASTNTPSAIWAWRT